MPSKKFKFNKNQKRFLDGSLEVQQDNLIKMSFSSEVPYKRYSEEQDMYYWEVLSHKEGYCDFSRLNDGANVLFNHNWNEPIGKVQKAWVENGRGYSFITISSAAEKYKKMVEDGTLTKVSVGYEVLEMIFVGYAEDGLPIFECKWMAFEESIVTVPADTSVGIGRAKKSDDEVIEVELQDDELAEGEAEKSKNEDSEVNSSNEDTSEDENTKDKDTDENTSEVVNTEEDDKSKEADKDELTEEEKNKQKNVGSKFDIRGQISQNSNTSTNNYNKGKNSMKDILEAGKKYNEHELANEYASQGRSMEEFQSALLEKKLSKGSNTDAGTQRELDKFSFAGYIDEVTDKREGANSGLAKELTQDFIKQGYKGHGGIILSRDLVNAMRLKAAIRAAGSYAMGTPEAFGNTAYTDRRTQIIDQLYNASVWNSLSTVMPSAEGFGDVTLPIITSKNNVQMLGEGVAATKSRQGSDHLHFTPKTAKASTSYTRETTQRSSLASVDSVIMGGLVKAMFDKRNQQWINGTGVDGEVLGIFNMSGVTGIDFGANGGNVDFAKLVAFETALAAANVDVARCAYLTNSKVAGSLKTTQKFANFGSALLENGQANGYPLFVSNEVASNYTKGTGTALSGMAFVNPEDIAVIDWNAVEFRVNPWIEEDGGVRIDAWDTFDMQALRAVSLAIAKDIK